MRKIILAIVAILPAHALAFTPSMQMWSSVKTVRCIFDSGVRFAKGKAKISDNPYGKNPITYDAINIKEKTARVINDNGGSDLIMRPITNSYFVTFEEETPIGNQIFTTLAYDHEGELHAVISSHFAVDLNGPVFEQSYGTCKVVN